MTARCLEEGCPQHTWTRRVASGPLFLSSDASMHVPAAGLSGFALNCDIYWKYEEKERACEAKSHF